MYILNITMAIKTMSINEIKDFIFENHYKWIRFSKKKQLLFNETLEKKDWLLLGNKLIEIIPDPCKAKEHYQSFIINKNRKSAKQSEIITYQPKTFDIADTKSVIT